MKFIIDAQLPYRLAVFFRKNNLDAIHTDDLVNKERTSDNDIRLIAKKQKRIVITKDRDFLDSHLLKKQPERVLFITTGNINNNFLIKLFVKNIDTILNMFKYYYLIEMNQTELLGYE